MFSRFQINPQPEPPAAQPGGAARVPNHQDRLLRLLRSFWFGAFLLLTVQAKSVAAAWASWDLPLWDSSLYYEGARRLIRSFSMPPLDWAPLYSGYLALFNLLFKDKSPFQVYLLQRALVHLLLPLFMLWVLRRVLHPLLAIVLAAWWAAMVCIAKDEFVVHAFSLLPIASALVLATCKRWGRIIGLPVAMLLATLVRPEFVLGLAVVLVWLICAWLKKPRRRAAFVMLAVVLAGVVLLVQKAAKGERAWLAFGQHYSVHYGEHHPEWPKDPWIFWEEPTRSAFGNARTVLGALRANPTAVGRHVLDNVRSLPAQLLSSLRPGWAPIPYAWSGLCAVAAIGCVRSSRFDEERKPRMRRCSLARFRRMLPAAAACGLPVMVSLLLIRPKDEYIVMVAPLAVLAIGLGLEFVLFRARKLLRVDLVLGGAILAIISVRPVPARPQPPSVAAAVDAIERTLDPGHPYRLLAMSATAFCGAYLQAISCVPVELESIDWNKGMGRAIQEAGVDVVLVDAVSRQRLPARLSMDVLALEQAGWSRIYTEGSYSIYLRPAFS